jgi:hypothetical protein
MESSEEDMEILKDLNNTSQVACEEKSGLWSKFLLEKFSMSRVVK